MNTDFLTRLWWACSDEGKGPLREGLNLCELYEHTEEKRQALRSFDAALAALDEGAAGPGEIDRATNEALNAAELQGFINGWRLCAMLQGEVQGKGGAT